MQPSQDKPIAPLNRLLMADCVHGMFTHKYSDCSRLGLVFRQSFQQKLIEKWERPPNTSPPEHPKFFRKVKKSTGLFAQLVRRGVLGKTNEDEDDEGGDKDDVDLESSDSDVADKAGEALSKARERLEQPEASGSQ
eukprot:CAMPEP_0114256408 /NCGR_PEP_ID=MMETSP0058-20121206/18134_1 /TAXON_ID=36894 /ORGANISM="Pyramimonas parkeae, CCMP726" /LENGTH=135 /DNA_ID=CAMNT_0001370967 /DNA_START=300 /DNA_END=707 /DNA_ORIENTATION=-